LSRHHRQGCLSGDEGTVKIKGTDGTAVRFRLAPLHLHDVGLLILGINARLRSGLSLALALDSLLGLRILLGKVAAAAQEFQARTHI
jgi:hypothetical protein